MKRGRGRVLWLAMGIVASILLVALALLATARAASPSGAPPKTSVR